MAPFYEFACCFLVLAVVFAQTRPAFEVASIRPSSDQVNATEN